MDALLLFLQSMIPHSFCYNSEFSGVESRFCVFFMYCEALKHGGHSYRQWDFKLFLYYLSLTGQGCFAILVIPLNLEGTYMFITIYSYCNVFIAYS